MPNKYFTLLPNPEVYKRYVVDIYNQLNPKYMYCTTEEKTATLFLISDYKKQKLDYMKKDNRFKYIEFSSIEGFCELKTIMEII